jgi:P-type Na+/K+ transporter
LIAVLTITMAVGMKRMVKRKVIVRRLDALEALGGVSNICSDKTGTLTQGKMVTRKAWIPGVGIYSVERNGEAADPTSGSVRLGAVPADITETDAEKEYERRQEERDQARSALALKFADDPRPKTQRKVDLDTPDEPDTPEGEPDGNPIPDVIPELEAFLYSAALCNLATVRFDEQKQKWQATGDPTEVFGTTIEYYFDT